MSRKLPPQHYYLIGALFAGLYMVVDQLVDVIAKKSLGASPLVVTVLTMLPPTSLLCSVFIVRIVEAFPRQRLILRSIAFIGRFSFVIFIFYINVPLYLLIFSLSYITFTLFNPMLNAFLSTAFSSSQRSRYVGQGMAITAAVAVVFSRIAGYVLDTRPDLKGVILAIGGVGGFLLIFITSAPFNDVAVPPGVKGNRSVIAPLVAILKADPVFLRFEAYFFIYGAGFMIILPSIPKYLVQTLGLDYSMISAAKVLIPQVLIIFFAPLVGRLHGRNSPQKFSGMAFLVLSAFPLLLGSAAFFGPRLALVFLFASYALYGFGMLGVNFAWAISTIELARHGTPQQYQAIHLSLTGIRGLIVPPLGYLLLVTIPMTWIFVLSFGLFLCAGLLMLRENRAAPTVRP